MGNIINEFLQILLKKLQLTPLTVVEENALKQLFIELEFIENMTPRFAN
jgi:hypothetical protein